VELDHFVADALFRWRPIADRCWQLGGLDPVIGLADAERLGLALDALLENAVQHTRPDDLIRLSLAADHGSRLVSVIVQDTGAGIAADELAQIFERFATGVQPVAGRRGTGLGLSLVRAVAEGHGGEVKATSVPGLGSKFEVVLPIGPVAPPALSAGTLSASPEATLWPMTPSSPSGQPTSVTVVTATGGQHDG
jgi:signal transduction histidine kinase